MNLLTDKWIPIIRKDGTEELIRPSQITADYNKNPIERINAARPDFTGALYQFLIGIMQTVMTPNDNDEWVKYAEEPPTVEQLDELFQREKNAFNLDGNKPRFMQDYDLEPADENPISGLFIEAPGANTIKLNKDHFIKRGYIQKVCAACAATALFTLQTNAPSGGVGHRTSLRGGGPMTVLYAPKGSEDDPFTLWLTVWYNIVNSETLKKTGASAKKSKASVYPWMAPTTTSEAKTGKTVTGKDIHYCQVYWSMPRRIVISKPIEEAGICDICGIQQDTFFTDYTTKNYGIDYSEQILHPLSPYYLADKQGTLLPTHPQPGGFSYRNWPILALSITEGSEPPITLFDLKNRLTKQSEKSIFVFGYDMDNMKARCWYEATMPLYNIPKTIEQDVTSKITGLISAAEQVVYNTREAVKKAWYKRPGDKKGDVSFIENTFWEGTESFFFEQVTALIDFYQNKAGTESIQSVMKSWHAKLVNFSLDLFEQYVERYPIQWEDPEQIINARDDLVKYNYSKKIKQALGLPVETNKEAG
ncbi:MAG: type I-E CRISPR-associated protein Cse1/CasA [Leptospiraceae bacterium]|nr:type I-E CRISPR-associated protein Cse1/CasA [Leptospiraceae bacterium]